MEKKIDWVVHMVMNGANCDVCGKREDELIPYACDAHTHGMNNYGHKEFQMVLAYEPKELMRILNYLGLKVQAGEKFRDGDMVSGIYLDCDVQLREFECHGDTVLRVIIPDRMNRFPDNPDCEEILKIQLLETDDLYIKNLS